MAINKILEYSSDLPELYHINESDSSQAILIKLLSNIEEKVTLELILKKYGYDSCRISIDDINSNIIGFKIEDWLITDYYIDAYDDKYLMAQQLDIKMGKSNTIDVHIFMIDAYINYLTPIITPRKEKYGVFISKNFRGLMTETSQFIRSLYTSK